MSEWGDSSVGRTLHSHCKEQVRLPLAPKFSDGENLVDSTERSRATARQ